MKHVHFEHRVLPVPETIEICPRCRRGLVFRPQPDVASCYVCGGIDASDQGLLYDRRPSTQTAPGIVGPTAVAADASAP